MFFLASKILWTLAAPSNLMALVLLAGAVLLFTRFARAGRRMVLGASLALVVAASGVPATLALRALEERFPRAEPAGGVAGVIVLGGAVDEVLTASRGPVALTDSAERMTEGVALARLHPDARIVFTGGSGRILATGLSEAEAARALWTRMGLEGLRVIYEDRSRNTEENARFTRDLVQPKAGETWLLVTSAYHMPRAMGLFRAAGFSVAAWPVDYRTHGSSRDLAPMREASQGLLRTDLVTREWIGLVAYAITGRTGALLPAP